MADAPAAAAPTTNKSNNNNNNNNGGRGRNRNRNRKGNNSANSAAAVADNAAAAVPTPTPSDNNNNAAPAAVAAAGKPKRQRNRKNKNNANANANTNAKMSDAAKPDAPKASDAPPAAAGEKTKEEPVDTDPLNHKTSSDYYWNSYAHFGIHEEMLKDEVRTRSYKNAIYGNKHLFKGKTVMDVGCGTGILSLFAAKAGAKRVYGMECSDIADHARQIVKDNGYEHIVTIVKGKVEDVELPGGPDEKVDIIISEWMGYFLLYESMLDTVLVARDRWLRPGGLLFPDKATMYVCGIEDGKYKHEKLGFWDNVYGFKMSSIKETAFKEPLVDSVDGEAIATDSNAFFTVDLNTVKADELEFARPFTIAAQRNDNVHALVVYFDIVFSGLTKPVYFSTGPRARYTHWKQTVFYLRPVVYLQKGEKLQGTITSKRNAKNPRDLDISIAYTADGKYAKYDEKQEYWLR